MWILKKRLQGETLRIIQDERIFSTVRKSSEKYNVRQIFTDDKIKELIRNYDSFYVGKDLFVRKDRMIDDTQPLKSFEE